jgi:hypothetical protein
VVGGWTLVVYRDQTSAIHVVPADGAADRRLVVKAAAFPCLSPDARWIVYTAQGGDSKQDVFMRRFDDADTTVTSLVRAKGDQRFPTISPDGTLLAYWSNESGISHIYLTTFPVPTGKWQVSVDESTWPVWSPVGDRLYFCSDTAVQYVSVEPGPPIRLGSPSNVVDVAKAISKRGGAENSPWRRTENVSFRVVGDRRKPHERHRRLRELAGGVCEALTKNGLAARAQGVRDAVECTPQIFGRRLNATLK